MQLNKAVPSKHSNEERGRNCGMIYISLKPVSIISSVALNKLLLKESLHRRFYGREGWMGKAHMKAESNKASQGISEFIYKF